MPRSLSTTLNSAANVNNADENLSPAFPAAASLVWSALESASTMNDKNPSAGATPDFVILSISSTMFTFIAVS